MAVFLILTYYSLDLRGETAYLNWDYSLDARCSNVAYIVDAVWAGGEGATANMTVGERVIIGSGLVVLNASGNNYYCPVSLGAVPTGTVQLDKGAHTLTNGGDKVVFST